MKKDFLDFDTEYENLEEEIRHAIRTGLTAGKSYVAEGGGGLPPPPPATTPTTTTSTTGDGVTTISQSCLVW